MPIPDEDAEAARARIGIRHANPAWHERATASAIWNFCCGLGDDNPLWWDAEYAGASRWGGVVAPPSYLYCCSNGIPAGSFQAAGEESGPGLFPGAAALWFGDDWTWDSLLRLEEKVSSASYIEAIEPRDRPNGEHRYLVRTCTEFRGSRSRRIASLVRNMLYFGRELEGAEAPHRTNYQRPTYSLDDMDRMVESYRSEYESRAGLQGPLFEDITQGQSIGSILKGPLTITNMIAWMGAWGGSTMLANRLAVLEYAGKPGTAVRTPSTGILDTWAAGHWDAEIARETGLPDGYDFGAQRIAWMTQLLTDWAGGSGMLRSISVRLRRPNLLGDVTTISGTVTSSNAQSSTTGSVSLAVVARNQRNEETATADAVVLLPRAEKETK